MKKKLIALMMTCLMMGSALVGCGSNPASGEQSSGSQSGSAEEPVEIIWFVRNDMPEHYDEVMAAVNEKMKADINMTLDLRFISPGDYNDKMQMTMAGGDEWDLCFTSHWANNYVNAAGKGAYLELTPEMLKENAPHVMETIPEKFWDGIRINGNLYGMMNYQAMYDQCGFWFDKQAIEEQNIDLSTVKDWDSLNAVLDTLAKAYPDKYATRGGGAMSAEGFFRKEWLSPVMNYPWLCYNPETKKIENEYFFEENSEFYENVKLWKDNNWTPADAATLKDENTLINSGKILSRYSRNKPGVEAALKAASGRDRIQLVLSEPCVNTMAAQSTITAVNVNSKHPEKAIQLFDYVFSNKEVANMLFFGLEGLDYELVDGRVKRLEGCWKVPQWELGNQFNAMLTVEDPEGVWEETIKGNEEATLDALFGFVPNREPIETELATCEAIWAEYKDILMWGLRDYQEVVPEMLSKMREAGLEKITSELQTQVDAFLAGK